MAVRTDSPRALSVLYSSIPVRDTSVLKMERLAFRANSFRFPHLEVISWCILEHEILQLIKALLDVIC